MGRYLTTARFGLRGILVISLLALFGLIAVACSAYGGYGSTAPTQAPVVAGTTPVPPPAATTAPTAPAASATSVSSTVAPGASQDVQATLTEFTITLSTQTMKAGQVRFNAANTGKFPHALEITGQGIDMKTENLNPGQSATLAIDLVPGKYEVWCPVDSHKERGMDTSITVQ